MSGNRSSSMYRGGLRFPGRVLLLTYLPTLTLGTEVWTGHTEGRWEFQFRNGVGESEGVRGDVSGTKSLCLREVMSVVRKAFEARNGSVYDRETGKGKRTH